jgi:DNA primase
VIVIEQSNNDLAKVLLYYNLYEENAEYKIICPFHKDINPSMMVSLRSNKTFFHCFGCGASGGALDFVRLANLEKNQIEVIQTYHKILKSKKTQSLKRINYDLIEKDSEYFEDQLVTADNYYTCLSTTKWNKLVCDDFGYNVKKYLNRRGFSDSTLQYVRAKYTFNDSYPIVFPMFDNGEFRGWVSRTDSKEIEKKRKYLYNKGFSRKNTLVGEYGRLDSIIVVEGYMDRLSFIQAGFTNVVAILGWKASEQQVKKLKQAGIKYLVSALDNDSCGKKGTLYLKKHFKVIRFQFPSGVKDPGDMNKQQITAAVNAAKLEHRRLKDVTVKRY